MEKVKIFVCCHKEGFCLKNQIYEPIQVGRVLSAKKLDMIGDDTGDNISAKNPNYCELTGMYWAWKNLRDIDIVGLCHYRRYFDLSSINNQNREPYKGVQNVPDVDVKIVEKILSKYDIILPGESFICDSVWDAYAIEHCRADLVEVEKAIEKYYPEYLNAFEHVMRGRNHYTGCNMLICKKAIYDDYCEWLFKILGEAERHIDISCYDSYQSRIYGFISERLLNVYVYYKNLSVCHRPIVSLIEGKTPNRLKQILHKIKANLCFKLKY